VSRPIVFAIPGDIDLPTGGYAYDRRVMAEWRAAGRAVTHLPLPGSFPAPTGAALAETGRALAAVSPDAVLLVDGLAYGACPAAILSPVRAPMVALVHHPLALETGTPPDRVRVLQNLETTALSQARGAIVTSPATADILAADYRVPADRIAVAVPGTDAVPRAMRRDEPPVLLAVGSVVPRKAYPLLIEALARLKDRDWMLTIAGAADRDIAEAARLSDAIAGHGLTARVTVTGAVEPGTLARLYAGAHAVVSSSVFEGFGMVLTEALAHGLPVVASTGGAAGETLPDEAALKVLPGDEAALSAAIARLLDEPALADRLADAAWQHARTLPRWPDTARLVLDALDRFAP
jgi:glycosyltransferase involved in cell wall biosynthesis